MTSLSVLHLRLFHGFVAGQRGDLLEAEDDLRAAELNPVARTMFRPGYLADVLIERGAVAEAQRSLELARLGERTPEVLRLPYVTLDRASTCTPGGWIRRLPASARWER